MSNYCNQKGRVCHNCNENGFCQTTGCIFPDATKTATLKASDIKYTYVRECQICGKTTEGIDYYICSECRRRLTKILYGE